MYATKFITALLATTTAIVLATVTDARSTGNNVLEGLLSPISIDPSTGALLRRQGAIPSVPTQCQSLCNPINSVLSSGTCPRTQCCTATFTKGYFDCFQCVAGAVGLTDFTTPQNLVDSIITTCASFGISLPVLTFPGQNPSRTLATLAPPSTSNTPPTSRTTISNTDGITSTPSTTPLSQRTVTSLPTTTSPPPAPSPSTTPGADTSPPTAPAPSTAPGAGTALRVTRGGVLGGVFGAFVFAKLLVIIL